MSERKVLNKYFPPDFDPSKIPRRKMPKDSQMTVRLMAPFTMSCNTCGEFIYKGKKFNAKKETAQGEEYYGIKIFRFYIKCTRCSAEITFKTDPKNADYICEHGAKRNFEPTTAEASHVPNAAEDSEGDADSDPDDPMKALEDSQAASKRQMEDEDLLADLRQRNARLERGDVDLAEVMRARDVEREGREGERRRREEQEDEEVVKRFFYKVSTGKGKARLESVKEVPAGGVIGDGYGSSDGEADEPEQEPEQTVTVKRSTASTTEPTVQDLLAAKGIALPSTKPAAASTGKPTGGLGLGIKRKDGTSGLGVKLVKKKKIV